MINGHQRTWSRFPLIAASVVIAALCSVVAVAVSWRIQQDREDARLCERSVAVREDGRAMWLWLFDEVGDTSDPARLARAKAQLDLLLPSLTCDDANHPIPIVDSTPPSPAD